MKSIFEVNCMPGETAVKLLQTTDEQEGEGGKFIFFCSFFFFKVVSKSIARPQKTHQPTTQGKRYYTRLIKPRKEQKTGTHYYSLLALENKKQQEKQRERKGNNNISK
jgi:hypothetical protein